MTINPLETCQCGSLDWRLEKSDIHGFGIRCARCNKFLRWTGKEKAKSKNPKFAEKHRQRTNGDRICDLCGISETQAKLFGWHFTTDHRIAEDFGGDDSFENTRPLCSPCHYVKTSLEHTTREIIKFLENINGSQVHAED